MKLIEAKALVVKTLIKLNQQLELYINLVESLLLAKLNEAKFKIVKLL